MNYSYLYCLSSFGVGLVVVLAAAGLIWAGHWASRQRWMPTKEQADEAVSAVTVLVLGGLFVMMVGVVTRTVMGF